MSKFEMKRHYLDAGGSFTRWTRGGWDLTLGSTFDQAPTSANYEEGPRLYYQAKLRLMIEPPKVQPLLGEVKPSIITEMAPWIMVDKYVMALMLALELTQRLNAELEDTLSHTWSVLTGELGHRGGGGLSVYPSPDRIAKFCGKKESAHGKV